MSTRIHPQARTTPNIRQVIKDSGLSDREVAKVFNITRVPRPQSGSNVMIVGALHVAHEVGLVNIGADPNIPTRG
jgi:predicted XRE-type DNA-binding protein